LRGCAFDWLNYIKETDNVHFTLWSRIKPHFKYNYNIQIQTMNNVWDFSKPKHKVYDSPANLKWEVSKLINNVSSTAAEY
jgi:GH43 family beta-xylosidase